MAYGKKEGEEIKKIPQINEVQIQKLKRLLEEHKADMDKHKLLGYGRAYYVASKERLMHMYEKVDKEGKPYLEFVHRKDLNGDSLANPVTMAYYELCRREDAKDYANKMQARTISTTLDTAAGSFQSMMQHAVENF